MVLPLEKVMSDTIKLINIQLIDRPIPPVRLQFNEEEINALMESISANGILVPLLVRPVGERYEVIDGDCRLEAANRLRIREVACVVRITTDSETHILRLVANQDRSNPDVVSEAIYYSKAIQSGSITLGALCVGIKKSEAWVNDRLDIAQMPEYMQDALQKKLVPLGVALIYFRKIEEPVRERWFFSAIRDGATIRTAQDAAHEYEKVKHIYEDMARSPEERMIPDAPPVTLIECAACGIPCEVSQLKFVRIHGRGCPPPEGTSPPV